MKETKEHWLLSWITGRGTYQEAKFDEDAEKVDRVLPQQGLHHRRASASPRSRRSKTARTRKRAGCSCASRSTKGRATASASSRSTATRSSRPSSCAALQAEDRRLVLGEADSQGPREGARGVRRRRLLRVHRLPGPRAGRAAAEGPIAGPGGADRQRHDAHDGRRAVLRQPPHVHRQHHDARQRHPPRDAPGRRRRRSTPKR